MTQRDQSIEAPVHAVRLSGDWLVQSTLLDDLFSPRALSPHWITVPECAHLQTALYPDQPYWGDHIRAINERAWVFQRAFTVPDVPYRRARLRFEGVDYFAEVWLNGVYVGEHEGHFNPFEFDVTPLLRLGENTLIVRVTAPWDAPNPTGNYPIDHVIRGLVKGLYEHGEGVIPPNVNPLGIWRPTWLLLDHGVSVDHIRIRTELTGEVNLRLRVTNGTGAAWSGTLGLTITAANHDGRGAEERSAVDVPPGTHEIERTLTIPDPRLWWCWDQGLPNLYQLEAALLEGDAPIAGRRERFGVRVITLERHPRRFVYWLNERAVFVRGSAYMPGLYLSQCTRDSLAADVALARDANLNLLRVHVHVAPPELYDLCDETGMLVWQDFELNWTQERTSNFERRARLLQRDMIDLLGNHPAIITWACHNEPTMVFARRHNLEERPDPALYADARQQDPTRPTFICSGQMEDDWQRSGDMHSYYGSLWSSRYTDIYRKRARLHSEFGVEAPAALSTLRIYPDVWERLRHLEAQIEPLWAYQAALVQYQVEHMRRTRSEGGAGYVHFWLTDLVPQVGCGVLDARRVPKGGYEALRRASQPLLVALEHDGRRPKALWVFNDTPYRYSGVTIHWRVLDSADRVILEGEITRDVERNAARKLLATRWKVASAKCARVVLSITTETGYVLCKNEYSYPFRPLPRPIGYPWKFDPYLGTKVFDRPDAASLADHGVKPPLKWVPLALREVFAERALRMRLPSAWLSVLARIGDAMLG